jgi:hypothetical protein
MRSFLKSFCARRGSARTTFVIQAGNLYRGKHSMNQCTKPATVRASTTFILVGRILFFPFGGVLLLLGGTEFNFRPKPEG